MCVRRYFFFTSACCQGAWGSVSLALASPCHSHGLGLAWDSICLCRRWGCQACECRGRGPDDAPSAGSPSSSSVLLRAVSCHTLRTLLQEGSCACRGCSDDKDYYCHCVRVLQTRESERQVGELASGPYLRRAGPRAAVGGVGCGGTPEGRTAWTAEGLPRPAMGLQCPCSSRGASPWDKSLGYWGVCVCICWVAPS